MSQEKTIKNLEDLGFSKIEAQIYLLLGRRGPLRAKDIVGPLKVNRQRLYEILKGLEKRGLINASLEHPAKFSALPFEKVLDLFVKTKMQEAHRIEKNKNEILSDWQSICILENSEKTAKFTVLEGSNYIYSKLNQMVGEAKNQLLLVATARDLIHADQMGLLDEIFNSASKSKIQLKVLTEVFPENLDTIKTIFKKTKFGSNIEGRSPELGLKLPNPMIICDKAEIAFGVTSNESNGKNKESTWLWTTCETLVDSFSAFFNEVWCSSTEIRIKIGEIETGKPSEKSFVINETKLAEKKYFETLQSAKEQIIIMTSAIGLLNLGKNLPLIESIVNNGVSVKIMGSIVSENLTVIQKLMKYCEVRHVPVSYLAATTVDDRHFFQFKIPRSLQKNGKSLGLFESAFYTNDVEYVNRMRGMLSDLWDNAQVSGYSFLAENMQPLNMSKHGDSNKFDVISKEYTKIIGVSRRAFPLLGKITEKEVIAKITDATRLPIRDDKDTLRSYGSMGIAIVRPPERFELPNFIIQVFHNNEKSSFGSENLLKVFVETIIAGQRSYLSTVFVTDNPVGYKFRKESPQNQVTENIQLLGKDELKVQVEGNRLFAGWTVPIALIAPKYILSPGCIIFDGYGETKSYTSEIFAFNRKTFTQRNSLEAFVTFMQPSLNYRGPGTDGLMHREIITISYPPSLIKEDSISTSQDFDTSTF